MFQTNKPLALFLVETLENLLQQFYTKFAWSEKLEAAKTTLKLLKIDIPKKDNRVFQQQN